VTARLLLACLLLVVSPARGWAQGGNFDSATAAAVWGAALSYIAPRALDSLTIPQMTLWGLNGLTALDPDLNTRLVGNQIRLFGATGTLATLPAPASATDAAAWAHVAASLAAAAYSASPALQAAGTQGIIANFFDELFNHFDPYSRYEAPLQAAQDQLLITGIAGTGISFDRSGNAVIIAAIAPGSPAQNAGLVAGTAVLRVGGSAAIPAAIPALNAAMNGIYGTEISLRLAGDPPQDVTLVRAFIPANTVFPEPAPAPKIAALRISGFNRGTSEQFSTAIAAAFSATPAPTGLIIDLRGNRGGVLRQAILAADSLLTAGRIATQAGRDTDANIMFTAEGADLTQGAPITILVDGQTASAAEIFAAALADNHRAVIIGSETLGKGLVQTITSLPDGGELYITWARVLAPRDWPLQTLGVMPNICTSLGELALDAQLAALTDGRNLMSPPLNASRALHPGASVDSILAVRDDCPADTGSDMDMAAAAFVLQHPAAYAAALLH
jgi:carboxyl-terminal processing protease